MTRYLETGDASGFAKSRNETTTAEFSGCPDACFWLPRTERKKPMTVFERIDESYIIDCCFEDKAMAVHIAEFTREAPAAFFAPD